MTITSRLALALAVALFPLGAAYADDGKSASVPHPADLALLAIGIAGVVIGRHTSRSRRRDD